eukprot:899639-Rhodomonas_salina.1
MMIIMPFKLPVTPTRRHPLTESAVFRNTALAHPTIEVCADQVRTPPGPGTREGMRGPSTKSRA